MCIFGRAMTENSIVFDIWIYFKSNEPGNSRLVYVKHTFSTNCILQRTSRLHQMHTLKIKCRLVYTKCLFFFWKVTSGLHQTPIWGSRSTIGRKRGCGFLVNKLEMHSVKWRPVFVKHTLSKNDTLHRASRLHQMHIRKIKCCLAYAKCLLF